jgi:putative ABC transport system permease protein
VVETLLIISEQFFLYVPLILGAYIVFSLMKVPNLSIEAAYISGAIVASKMLMFVHTMPIIISLPFVCCAAMVGGLCVGLLVAFLDVQCKIPHLLASILALGLCYGGNLYLLGSANESLTRFTNPLCTSLLPMHPELITLAIIGLCLIGGLLFFLKTALGFSVAVYGNNPRFFRFYGISTPFVVSAGLMISNALAGLSGYLVAQSSSFVDLNAGQGIALFGITALILGKMIVRKQYAISVMIPMIGLLVYCVIQQFLLKIGFNLKYFTALQALIVLGLLIVQYQKSSEHDRMSDNLGV